MLMHKDEFKFMVNSAMDNQQPRITLLTDFGTQDGFIGVMKGVMLQIAPNAQFIDISHDLPPFSVTAAAFLNEWSYGYFPTGTVHLCVVDPGVGTQRRILVVETCGHIFVAPDNGLLTPILDLPEKKTIVSATNKRYWLDKISHTFHGRDIFSPVAAHLAKGVQVQDMGETIHNPIRLDFPYPVITKDYIECQIHYIDRFGNLITNLDRMRFSQWIFQRSTSAKNITIEWEGTCLHGISEAYGEKSQNELLAVFDGYDRLEIAENGGSAAQTTGMKIGSPLRITTCAGERDD